MDTFGLFVAFLGAALLFLADWMNLTVDWIAALLFVVSAIVGFCLHRWRLQVSMFLTLSLVAAEWAVQKSKVWSTHLNDAMPNMLVLAGLAFILAITASLIGAGVRSFFDAGKG